MKVSTNHTRSAILVGLCWAFVSGAAHAESDTARHHAALRNACAEHGGRFEQSWIYNDQGLRWGRIVSCATDAGYVSCQGNACRGARWIRHNGAAGTVAGPDNNNDSLHFSAEPAAFSAALTTLSEQ